MTTKRKKKPTAKPVRKQTLAEATRSLEAKLVLAVGRIPPAVAPEQACPREECRAAQRVWSELACIVGCTSPSGDAELGQVRFYQEKCEEYRKHLCPPLHVPQTPTTGVNAIYGAFPEIEKRLWEQGDRAGGLLPDGLLLKNESAKGAYTKPFNS